MLLVNVSFSDCLKKLVRTEVRIEKHVLKLVRSDVRIEKHVLDAYFTAYLFFAYQLIRLSNVTKHDIQNATLSDLKSNMVHHLRNNPMKDKNGSISRL